MGDRLQGAIRFVLNLLLTVSRRDVTGDLRLNTNLPIIQYQVPGIYY